MKSRSIHYWILLCDIVWITVTLGLAPGLRYDPRWHVTPFAIQTFALTWSVSIIVWLLLYWMSSLDGFSDGWQPASALSKSLVGSLIVVIAMAVKDSAVNHVVSPIRLLSIGLLLVSGLFAIRLGTFFGLRSEFLRRFRRRLIVAGHDHVARALVEQIQSHPELLCDVVGILSTEPSSSVSDRHSQARMDGGQTVEFIRLNHITDLIICNDEPGASALAKQCQRIGIHVSLIPRSYELYTHRSSLSSIGGLPIVSLEKYRPSWLADILRPVFNLLVACALIVITSPFSLVMVVYLAAHQRSIIRRETRCGRNGVPFAMLRFNLDRHEATSSRFEQLMQNLGVTELPQLANVLRREMSVVGPRPQSLSEVEKYSEWQNMRLQVPPGITGPAQVRGLREHHPTDERALLDAQYLLGWSPLSDVFLLLQTAWTLLRRVMSASESRPGSTRSILPSGEEI
jgi:lipopolysaccharide/colanic/teichoic acid biosynthesis glycosyltransferase